jgi:hypothetical protein
MAAYLSSTGKEILRFFLSNPTIITRNTRDLCAGENCKVARARDIAACMHKSLSNVRTYV